MYTQSRSLLRKADQFLIQLGDRKIFCTRIGSNWTEAVYAKKAEFTEFQPILLREDTFRTSH